MEERRSAMEERRSAIGIRRSMAERRGQLEGRRREMEARRAAKKILRIGVDIFRRFASLRLNNNPEAVAYYNEPGSVYGRIFYNSTAASGSERQKMIKLKFDNGAMHLTLVVLCSTRCLKQVPNKPPA